ncbi:AraC family transcriptional regulator [Bacillus cereus]|nr:AraC family transcriptional regulator [Bacillus cereus]
MYHFHRIFQSYIGMSVTDYIRKRRLTHAAQALVSTERAVIEIWFFLTRGTYESF